MADRLIKRDQRDIQRELDEARALYREWPSEYRAQRCERLLAEMEDCA